MDAVPFVDLARDHAPLSQELDAAFARVAESSAFILGEEVERFESEFAAYCGTRQCVGVASGTAALTLSLLAAGIGTGDEVVVPGHTYIATALAVMHSGATPVFCDVEPASGLIDVGSAARVIGERTAAIMPVHLYGQVCDMPGLLELAAAHDLALIEDAAQAPGATHDGSRAGSFGLAAGFSFYPSKPLGALGDGGAVCTDDEGLAARVRELRNIGQRSKGEHVVAGYNERLDGLQAALLRVKLPHLDDWNERRRERAGAYARALGDSVSLLADSARSPCVYHLFPVRSADRDALAAQLERAGVQTGVHYSPAVHRHAPVAAAASSDAIDLPEAEAWAAEELSLPMFAGLTDAEIEHVAQAWPRDLQG